jgi:hypothetical protein
MTNRPARFTQAELQRAIRAVLKAGASSYEVVIAGPRVIIRVPGHPLAPDEPVAGGVGSWDDAVAELERQ